MSESESLEFPTTPSESEQGVGAHKIKTYTLPTLTLPYLPRALHPHTGERGQLLHRVECPLVRKCCTGHNSAVHLHKGRFLVRISKICRACIPIANDIPLDTRATGVGSYCHSGGGE